MYANELKLYQTAIVRDADGSCEDVFMSEIGLVCTSDPSIKFGKDVSDVQVVRVTGSIEFTMADYERMREEQGGFYSSNSRGMIQ